MFCIMTVLRYVLLKGVVVLADPSTACSRVKRQSSYNQSEYLDEKWFLLIDADNCEFDTKVSYDVE